MYKPPVGLFINGWLVFADVRRGSVSYEFESKEDGSEMEEIDDESVQDEESDEADTARCFLPSEGVDLLLLLLKKSLGMVNDFCSLLKLPVTCLELSSLLPKFDEFLVDDSSSEYELDELFEFDEFNDEFDIDID
jgi:hypothetical protein